MSSRSLRVLLIEDSADDADLVLRKLSRGGFVPAWRRVSSPDEMRTALEEGGWDVVLADYSLPGFGAPAALAMLREADPLVPFIVVSGTIGEEAAAAVLREGASDYVSKGSLSRLVPVVERELREAENSRARRQAEQTAFRLAAVVRSSADAILSATPEGVLTSWNPGAARLCGWSEDETLGRHVSFLVPHGRADELTAAMAEARQGERVKQFETVWLHRDGRRIEVACSVSPVWDRADRLDGASVIARDIGGRKRAEAERDSLLNRLRLQIERMPLGYLMTGPDFRITDWNPAAEKIFGYTRDEVLGMGPPFEKIIPPAAWPGLEEVFQRLRSGEPEAHAVNENLTKDGRVIVCQWYNTRVLDAEGTFLGMISLAQDITTSRQAEQALRLRDRAIQAVTQGILITDPSLSDNPVTYASPGFERLTGYTWEEVRGRNCRFLQGKDTDPKAVALIREAVRHGRTCTVELLNYRRDGTPFWNELSISPVRDDHGRLTHFVGVQTDVTERRLLEQQYRQSQKMEAIGQLAGGVAHDFNNLLTIINGYSDLLLQSLPASDPGRTLVEEIQRAGERSASLTRQLLMFSRKQVVQPRVLDLNELVADAEKMLRRTIGEDILLQTVLRPRPLQVLADPGQLEQVLLNLAVNARDAMPTGGYLTVETGEAELAEEYAQSHPGVRPGRYVLLAVSDNGSGMTREVQERLFEPFFTTKGPGRGTGLGLAVVHGIVKEAGGHIGVYSEVGIGTTFKVYLPRASSPARPSHGGMELRPAPEGNETVLLVEDEEVVRALTRHVLAGCGYRVLEAGDGAEALRVAEGHRAPIHLMVTDVVMPTLGGRELAERLQALHPEAKVLYVSGYTDDAVVRHGVLQEQVQFLQKPFSPRALAFKVREVLDGV